VGLIHVEMSFARGMGEPVVRAGQTHRLLGLRLAACSLSDEPSQKLREGSVGRASSAARSLRRAMPLKDSRDRIFFVGAR